MGAFRIKDTIYNNPVQLALELIGGKWKMPILWRLKDGKLRFGQLKKSLNDHLTEGKITDRSLTIQLRELESARLITRKVYTEVPPKTEYTITALGLKTIPTIKTLQSLGRVFKAHMGARDISTGTCQPKNAPDIRGQS